MTQSSTKLTKELKMHMERVNDTPLNVVFFTDKGLALAKKLSASFSTKLYGKYEGMPKDLAVESINCSLAQWTYSKMQEKETLIFIGALGICVRSIAEGIKNKLTDAPVLVLDETGQFVIPVLSGHFGGANQLTNQIAEKIGAIPVITTATDLEETFSVDVFAKENNLSILNKEGIKKVSSKALEGKAVRLSIENYPPQNTDVAITSDLSLPTNSTLTLCPKQYAVGIGCKKDTPYENLKDFFEETLNTMHISPLQVGALGSIDLKTDEKGLILLGKSLKIPFITFTKELLQQAKGDYEESDFVKNQTGVGNVCERAAMLLTGNQGEILLHKTAKNGMTIAIAKCFDRNTKQ